MKLSLPALIALLAFTACDDAGKKKEATAQLAKLRAAVEAFTTKEGRAPDSLTDLEIAKLVDRIAPDPWGNSYVLRFEHGKPVVLCLGSDGQLGGEGSAADLRN